MRHSPVFAIADRLRNALLPAASRSILISSGVSSIFMPSTILPFCFRALLDGLDG
jgi:hypothetical protein